jgi:hypothetical protein
MNRKRAILLLLVVGLLVLQTGCIGPFNLTKQVYHWNNQVGQKWINEGLFVVFVIFPVYEILLIGDAILFNAIDFWGGDNPIDPPPAS